MNSKNEEKYTWILQKFKELLKTYSMTIPNVIVTNREQALLNALQIVFPRATICCVAIISRKIAKHMPQRKHVKLVRDMHLRRHIKNYWSQLQKNCTMSN